jgi:hypothetical protein
VLFIKKLAKLENWPSSTYTTPYGASTKYTHLLNIELDWPIFRANTKFGYIRQKKQIDLEGGRSSSRTGVVLVLQ